MAMWADEPLVRDCGSPGRRSDRCGRTSRCSTLAVDRRGRGMPAECKSAHANTGRIALPEEAFRRLDAAEFLGWMVQEEDVRPHMPI